MSENFPVPAEVPGVRVLLMGESGSGKTHSIRTALDTDVLEDIFVLFTEPGMEVLADLPHDHYHWAYVKPTAVGTTTLLDKVKKMKDSSWDAMQKQTNDPHKKNYDAGVRILQALHQPVCAECGKEFPDVTEWDNRKMIVLDSLSGLNQAAMQLVTGGAIAKSQPQWGAAMDTEMQIINQLCYDTNAHFVMTAHLDKQIDQINGGQIVRVNALGNKNAPEVPKNFSDVILTYRDEQKFRWSVASPNVETKSRNLPLRSDLTPDFKPILTNWRDKYSKKNEEQA